MDQLLLHELVEIARSMGHPMSYEEVSLSTKLPEDWHPDMPDSEVSFRRAYLIIVEDRIRLPWFTEEQIACLEYYADLMLFVKEHRAAIDRKLDAQWNRS
ncbi:MAG: hypothetical protein HZC02_04200 [Candidatus Levybacteria bacterium]|nr:hypothetical protein [Candidatus Levybacteria bacterium]